LSETYKASRAKQEEREGGRTVILFWLMFSCLSLYRATSGRETRWLWERSRWVRETSPESGGREEMWFDWKVSVRMEEW
jgi:hypothetical protein